jgi:hypothetical protein
MHNSFPTGHFGSAAECTPHLHVVSTLCYLILASQECRTNSLSSYLVKGAQDCGVRVRNWQLASGLPYEELANWLQPSKPSADLQELQALLLRLSP